MTIVLKAGSNILADAKAGLNERRILSIASAVASLRSQGHDVVLVSSGAIAAGVKRLGLKAKPVDIKLKQAAAAVGQSALMWTYEKCFSKHGLKVAQILLTRDALSNREMYLNAKNTLATLLSFGVIPIINENDTIATHEIRFGDNDQLAALVASLAEADRLIILSDVEGLYTADPNKDSSAKLIPTVREITKAMVEGAGQSISGVGTGGMYSKLLAARKAVRSGVRVNIINGKKPQRILDIIEGKQVGTEFMPISSEKLSARKGWIAYGSKSRGTLTLDPGAVRALMQGGKSLLPSGIVSVEGEFSLGDTVKCVDSEGNTIAKGITNYSAEETRRIMGKKTTQIEAALGYRYSDEVIHRDNLVLP